MKGIQMKSSPLKFMAVVVAAVFLVASYKNVNARDSYATKDYAALDVVSYSKQELIKSFFEAAFPKHMWFDNMPQPHRYFYSVLSGRGAHYKMKYAGYPWLYEYISREKGLPRFEAFSRWQQQEIKVSLGWPPMAVEQPDWSSFEALVEKQVQEVSSVIREETGIVLKFVPQSQESQKNFSQIRIVPDEGLFSSNNKFKSHRGVVDDPYFYEEISGMEQSSRPTYRYFRTFEASLVGAIRFTPMTRAQAEGYFLTDKDNNVTFSVCEIWPEHRPAVLRSLITECLLRSMGIPEMVSEGSPIALGHWNKKEGTSAFPIKISDYDKMMLRLLYCQEIDQSMGRYQLIEKLFSSDRCFDVKKEK